MDEDILRRLEAIEKSLGIKPKDALGRAAESLARTEKQQKETNKKLAELKELQDNSDLQRNISRLASRIDFIDTTLKELREIQANLKRRFPTPNNDAL